MFIVLGIDPGVRNTGFALCEIATRTRFSFIRCDTIKEKKSKTSDWKAMADLIFDVIDEYRPDILVVEDIVWYGARRGMYDLSKLVGAVWSYSMRSGIKTYLVAPRFKPKLTNKELKAPAKSEHELDAIALALWGYRYWKKNLAKKERNRENHAPTN